MPVRDEPVRSWPFVLGPVVATAAAYAPNLRFGFLGDAQFLLQHNTFMRDPGTLWGQLSHDYFWSSSGNTIPYWRPLTKASWLVETLLLGGSAASFHAVQLALHLATVIAAFGLTRQLGASRWAASACGLFVGLAPTAIEPVSLLMARSDVAAAAACTASLWAWLAWANGRRAAAGWHVLAVVVALASKETAVILAPLLLIWGGLNVRWNGWSARRALTLAAPAAVLACALLVTRKLVLSGHPSPAVTFDPARVLVGGARYIVAALPLQLATGLRNVGYDEAISLPSLAGAAAAWAGACTVLVWRWRRRDAAGLGMVAWAAGSLAPVLLVQQMNVPNVAGKFALADRWALQASIAVAVFVAARWPSELPKRAHRAATAAVGIWALLAVVAAPSSHAPYRNELSLLDKEDADFALVPAEFRTREDQCRYADRKLVRLLGDGRHADVVALTEAMDCPREVLRDFNRLAALAALGRWAEADQLADVVLADNGADTRHVPMTLHLKARARLHLGDSAGALRWLDRSRQAGLLNCGLLRDYAAAHAAAGNRKKAEEFKLLARSCDRRQPNPR